MKNLTAILIILVCLCTYLTTKTSFNKTLYSFIIINQPNPINRPNISSIQNEKLPFGCNLLNTHLFPEIWQNRDATDPEDTNIRPHEHEFNSIINCFNKLNSNKNIIKLPPINKLENIRIGNYEGWKFDNSLIYYIDKYNYKLPNFGIYECYYIFNIPKKDKPSRRDSSYCMSAGNLLLYNRKSCNAKVLNIYILLVDEFRSFQRFFYIDKNKSIKIYESVSYEEETSLKNKYTIVVLKNGEIKINENN